MKAKRIILLILAIVLMAAVIAAVAYFVIAMRDEIDITDTAKSVFSDFKEKAEAGRTETLDRRERKMCDYWNKVSEICLDSMSEVVDDYGSGKIEEDTAVAALSAYSLFPVTSGQISSFTDDVKSITDGRNAYLSAAEEKDNAKKITLLCSVNSRDTKYYPLAKKELDEVLDPAEARATVNKLLSHNYISDAEKLISALENMSDNSSLTKALSDLVSGYKESQENTYIYRGSVEVLSVRNLMAFTDKVYAAGSKYAKSYDANLITPDELRAILADLYSNNYILIPVESLQTDGAVSEIKIPSGKKPFVLICEDLTYPSANKGSGVVDRLGLDSDGRLCSYTDGEISYDNETPLILDAFAEENPDFVYKGARGCISLTGYDGFLGYREGEDGAKETAEFLRNDGWTFACGSYAYRDMAQATFDTLKSDTELWLDKANEIVGECSVYVWPYGSSVRTGEKHEYLYEKGFRIFCGVGINAYRAAEPDGKGIFIDRKTLSGSALRNYADAFEKLFDARLAIDSKRPDIKTGEE